MHSSELQFYTVSSPCWQSGYSAQWSSHSPGIGLRYSNYFPLAFCPQCFGFVLISPLLPLNPFLKSGSIGNHCLSVCFSQWWPIRVASGVSYLISGCPSQFQGWLVLLCALYYLLHVLVPVLCCWLFPFQLPSVADEPPSLCHFLLLWFQEKFHLICDLYLHFFELAQILWLRLHLIFLIIFLNNIY